MNNFLIAYQQHKGMAVKKYNKKISMNLPLSFNYLKINIELMRVYHKRLPSYLSSI